MSFSPSSITVRVSYAATSEDITIKFHEYSVLCLIFEIQCKADEFSNADETDS